MRGFFYLFLIYLTQIFAVFAYNTKYDNLWKAYQVRYSKVYVATEEANRRSIWEVNAEHVTMHNLEADLGLRSDRIELNKFSDRTDEELRPYRECFKLQKVSAKVTNSKSFERNCGKKCVSSLPKFVDWRNKGYVTRVKDQGDCGSCWAFSSTGSLEAQAKAKTGRLVELSEQNLVDCSEKQGNAGCDGGWMEDAFQYVIDNQGIDTEEAYPYQARELNCRFKTNAVGSNCTKFYKIKPGSEKDLQYAVATIGPVSIAIDVSGHFMQYKSGVYIDQQCSKVDLDHAVLVVGYGTQNGTDYWIVKNSWGTDWGMDGYILMARNKHNQCGIATDAVYPVV